MITSSKSNIIRQSAVFFGSLNVINSGMVYGWSTLSLPELSEENSPKIELHSWQRAGLAVAPFLGAIICAPLACIAPDFWGRKNTILFTSVLYIISWITISLTKHIELIFVARFMAGLSDACIFVSFPVYIEEICQHRTTRLYSIYPICFTIGVLLINLIALAIPLERAALIAQCIPMLAYGGMFFMPESPYYLLVKNKEYQAKAILKYLREDSDLDFEYEKLKKEVSYETSSKGGSSYMMSPQSCLFSIAILIAAQQLSGITALVFNNTTILKDSNNNFYFDHKFCIILFSLLLGMALLSAFLLDSNSSKFLLMCSLAGSATALFLCGLYFQLVDYQNDNTIYSTVPVGSLLLFIIFYGLGLQNIPFITINKIVPKKYKPKLLGAAYCYFSILAIIVLSFFNITNHLHRIHLAFYVFSACCVISFSFIFMFIFNVNDTSDESKYLLKPDEDLHLRYEFLLSSFEISDYSD